MCANYNGVLARYGGDEFCIACGCNSVEVRTLIASIQRELDAANAASGKPYQIEISIGCARLEPDIATVHDLIDKADQEMYHLKTRKRGISKIKKASATLPSVHWPEGVCGCFFSIRFYPSALASRGGTRVFL